MYESFDALESDLARLSDCQKSLELDNSSFDAGYGTDYSSPQSAGSVEIPDYQPSFPEACYEQTKACNYPRSFVVARSDDVFMYGNESDSTYEEESSGQSETEGINHQHSHVAPYSGMPGAREGRVTRSTTHMQQQQQMQQQPLQQLRPPPDPSFYNDPTQPNPQWINNQSYGDGSQQQFFNQAQMGDADESMDADDDYQPQALPRQPQAPASLASTSAQHQRVSSRSRETSSQMSETGSEKKRKKYSLKNDAERADEKYKAQRKKNNDSVKRTRMKKMREEEEKKEKNEKEKQTMKEIVKMFMEGAGATDSAKYRDRMSEAQKEQFDLIYKEQFPSYSRSPQFSRH